MELLITILICCGVFTIVGEFATYMTYGRMLSDDEVFDYLDRYEVYTINRFEHSILSGEIDWSDTKRVIQKIKEGDYISFTNTSLSTKYYISGKGTVGRWSKAAKKIDALYAKSEIK